MRDLHTVSQFANKTAFSEAQLRWIRFNSKSNGADEHGVFVGVGRRVYIDAGAFDAWVRSQNQGKAGAA